MHTIFTPEISAPTKTIISETRADLDIFTIVMDDRFAVNINGIPTMTWNEKEFDQYLKNSGYYFVAISIKFFS